ncbi:MAG: HEAT repeat domain-containing protein [Ignavibacteria bacterium]|nr:HEAT repeat domain-containing protein [Ignavibacteria bacterium]MBI3765157.1 HEAT repeat domain-containing protein [Ignavibacteriales bacterium]
MKHEQYKEWLQLSLYDELTQDERHTLDDHLNSCAECREEFDFLKKFHAVLTQHKSVDLPEQLLVEARYQLRGALRMQQSRRSFWDPAFDALREVVLPHYKIVFGGIALFVLGIVLGYLLFNPSSRRAAQLVKEENPIIQSDTRITNVRFLNTDIATGRIEFTFEAVKPVRMKGNINDESVQKILTHALLTEQNPGIRLQSINAIASRKSPDKEIKSALIAAVKTDENPGVRKEALKALERYPMDEEIKHTLLFVLTHERNAGLRIAAINYLDSTKVEGQALDQDVLNVLKEKMQSDDNNYIRLRAKAVVEEVRQ